MKQRSSGKKHLWQSRADTSVLSNTHGGLATRIRKAMSLLRTARTLLGKHGASSGFVGRRLSSEWPHHQIAQRTLSTATTAPGYHLWDGARRLCCGGFFGAQRQCGAGGNCSAQQKLKPVGVGGIRFFSGSSPRGSMFDSLKQWVGMEKAEEFDLPENFTLDDFGKLVASVNENSAAAGRALRMKRL